MLRQLGIEFGCILDVGLQVKTQELIDLFPDLKHYLFEPVTWYLPMIRLNYKDVDHGIINVAVSDRDGQGKLLIKKIGNSKGVTHSDVVTDDGPHHSNTSDIVDIELMRLSTLLSINSYPEPILLKIDVDGHEIAILNGLKGAEHMIGALVVEAGLSNFYERVHFLHSMGFVLWDICDFCYYKGCLIQFDLVFLSSEIAKKPQLRPLTHGAFDWTAWQSFGSPFTRM